MTPQCSSKPRLTSRERFARFGSIVLTLGVAILVFQGIESSQGIPGMPRAWHQNQSLWLALGLTAVVTGGRLLWNSELPRNELLTWRPAIPGQRFGRLVIYTRKNCSLCTEAVELLADYSLWLPDVFEVDIDTDPQLVQDYGTCIPVIACDSKIRFRGRIDETLLRRLIEGTPPVVNGHV
ncbi:MAG: glutaredoxin family protein [Planctomycetales bacterium]|jgi:hypothetical protein|nr:glutaredoxin family protein [Planctomycetales bacterium]